MGDNPFLCQPLNHLPKPTRRSLGIKLKITGLPHIGPNHEVAILPPIDHCGCLGAEHLINTTNRIADFPADLCKKHTGRRTVNIDRRGVAHRLAGGYHGHGSLFREQNGRNA